MFCEHGFETDADGYPICRCNDMRSAAANYCPDGHVPLKGFLCNADAQPDRCPFAYEYVMTTADGTGVCCPDQIGRLLIRLNELRR